MSPSNVAAQQLRQQVFYHIDNDFLENANFLAGRLHALEPRSPDSAHLLALTYFRLRRFKAAYDFSQKYGANGRHLGCAFVFAQACLHLGSNTDGVAALEKARSLWNGKSNWNKHTDTSRRHVPDMPAVYTLMAKLWQAHGDMKKAGDCYVEAHKGNPFTWDAFEGLCKVGADLDVSRMFKPVAGMMASTATSTGGTEIYTDQAPVLSQPLAPQNNFNQQTLTPSADPFNNSRAPNEAASQYALPNAKGRPTVTNGAKGSVSDWDTPTNPGGGRGEDTTMGGFSVESDVFAPQPPPAPSRRTRPGQNLEPSERSHQPSLRGQSGSESHEDVQRKPTAGGYKRTVSGQPTQPNASHDPAAAPRRSNRLFGQGTSTTKTTRSNTEPAAATVNRADRDVRPSKNATGTKGRIGSTVGRVVSGNRKILPPDRNEKEKERRAPSRASERTTAAPAPTAQKSSSNTAPSNSQADQQALTVLFDNFRELAIGYYATSRFECPLAIRTFRSLPSAQRETPWVLSQLGKAHYEAGDFRAAEDCFARVLKLQPSRIEDMEVYSTVLWHLKKDSALAFLCHLLREQAFHAPETWVALGNAFSLTREHDQAIAAFKRATQLDAGFAYAWTLMGHEHIANEEFGGALAAFRKAVAADARGYGGWYGLGKCYERLGKLAESERHYRVAASVNPSNATLLVCIGVVLERVRNKKGALANYARALELSPASALARFKNARVLMHMRLYEDALVELEVLRDQAPDEANVWFLLGKCYKGLGGKGEALRAFTTALNLDVKAAPFIKEAMESLDDDEGEASEDD